MVTVWEETKMAWGKERSENRARTLRSPRLGKPQASISLIAASAGGQCIAEGKSGLSETDREQETN